MNILVGGIIVLLIILFVYIFTHKSDIYANKIKINVFKLVNIEIDNKVKRFGKTANPPKRLK